MDMRPVRVLAPDVPVERWRLLGKARLARISAAHSRPIRPGGPVDADCLPALMRVTTAVLELGQRAAAGDPAAAAELDALARALSHVPGWLNVSE